MQFFCMPRYFFDHSDNDGMAPDEDGLELPNIEAAKVEATRALAEIGAEVLPGSERRLLAIQVREDSAVLFPALLMPQLPLEHTGDYSSASAQSETAAFGQSKRRFERPR